MITNYVMIRDSKGQVIGAQSSMAKAGKRAKKVLKCKLEDLAFLRFGKPNEDEHLYWYDANKADANYWIDALKRDDLIWNWGPEKVIRLFK